MNIVKLIALILALFILWVLVMRKINSIRTEGMCTITISIPEFFIRGVTVECMPPGGHYYPRKMTLYQMLESDLRDDICGDALQSCREQGIPFDVYQATVESIQDELSKVTLKSVFYLDPQTKQLCCNRLKFRYGSKKAVLRFPGEHVHISIREIDFFIKYTKYH